MLSLVDAFSFRYLKSRFMSTTQILMICYYNSYYGDSDCFFYLFVTVILIGALFLFLILLSGNGLNFTSSSSAPVVTLQSG